MINLNPVFKLRNPGSRFPLVIAMFTADRLHHAKRLHQSLGNLKLSHNICEIDKIHSSISVKGTRESVFTKPYFIKSWLLSSRRSVLYVDADVVFKSMPTLITQANNQGTQLALFNWLSPEDNQTYFRINQDPTSPITPQLNNPSDTHQSSSFARGFSIDHISTEQIIVSGAVQFWGNSMSAMSLLEDWQATILANPGARDDHCLDYAYNNFAERSELGLFSLPRAYCRYAWWPQVRPVIDHPDVPALNMPWQPLAPEFLEKRIHAHLLKPRPAPTPQSSNSPSA